MIRLVHEVDHFPAFFSFIQVFPAVGDELHFPLPFQFKKQGVIIGFQVYGDIAHHQIILSVTYLLPDL